MTVHVSQLVRVCVCQLRRIKTIRKFIPTSVAFIFVNHSFFVFRVDNYNSILACLQTCQLDRIQSVLITPLPVSLYGRAPSDHATDMLRDNLHWLRVPSGSKLCLITVITYKALNDRRMSDYISNFFIRIVADKGYDSRREIFYSSHGLLRSLAIVLSLSQEPLNGTAFPIM